MRRHSSTTYCLSAVLAIVLLCLTPIPTVAQDVTPDRLFEWVKGISGKDAEGRREYVRAELTALGMAFDELTFETTFERRGSPVTITGVNLVATIGQEGPVIVVGAHYDAVPGSPGSNDDGAGVAVLLGLASSLRSEGLPVTLQLCFFDQEERGLIGSSIFVRDHADRENHLAMMNLDIVGFGSEIYVGPVGGGDDEVLLPHVLAAAKTLGREAIADTLYPPSDHYSFAKAGLENIAISIVPKDDVKKVTAMLRGERMTEETTPIVMRTMHTPNDGIDTIEPGAMMTAYELVREVIRRLADPDTAR